MGHAPVGYVLFLYVLDDIRETGAFLQEQDNYSTSYETFKESP